MVCFTLGSEVVWITGIGCTFGGINDVNFRIGKQGCCAALREEVLYVIFLDLHKAYDALDRSRCLDILEGYGVGPWSRRLLQT